MERQIEVADNAQAMEASHFSDWSSLGESRTVEIARVRVTVRFVERKGRRARIAIVAPARAVFTPACHAGLER